MTKVQEFIASDPRYKAKHERRETAAASARKAQAAYKRFTRGFLVASTLAAITGGLVLYGIDQGPAAGDAAQAAPQGQLGFLTSGPMKIALRVLQALSVAAAALCAFVLNTQDFPKTWREWRGKAETLRHERGLVALEIGHEKGAAEFKQAGAFFYQDLVEGQIAFLNNAIKVYGSRAYSFTILGGLVMALGVGAPVLAQAGPPIFLVLSALAAIATPALLSGLKSWSEATASGERVKLHEATRDLLYEVAEKRLEFDKALEDQDLDAARGYADLALAALRSDVDGFMDLMKGAFRPPAPAIPKKGA